jgi:hypothetical protein
MKRTTRFPLKSESLVCTPSTVGKTKFGTFEPTNNALPIIIKLLPAFIEALWHNVGGRLFLYSGRDDWILIPDLLLAKPSTPQSLTRLLAIRIPDLVGLGVIPKKVPACTIYA